jgi:hypothetical protein
MKWELMQSSTEQDVYRLHDGGNKVLQLIFSPSSFSLRIDCNNNKRVFFVRREGFLKNRVVLRNEYGIRIGELGSENKQHFITMNDQKFFYSGDRSQFVVTRDGDANPIMKCEIELNQELKTEGFSKDKYPGNVHPGLLMAACWYKFQPVSTQKEVAALAIS